ncbi:MAG TPA: hypothetical protein VN408_41135, partial [Actinoplanes sp.]|nr:hypothetical protein [Actinoplanes sp.]
MELSAAEAVDGTAKSVPLPPDGTPTMIYFPPGAIDGSVLNVELPGIDPATGAAVNRVVPVTIRVLPAGPFPPTPAPGQQFPGQPQPGFPLPPGQPQPGFPPPPGYPHP